MGNLPRIGHKIVVGIFGIDAALHRMAIHLQVLLFERKRKPFCNPDLLPHQVHSHHSFRDRVLHLQAGVHLQEIKIELVIHDEFNRSGTFVMGCFGSRYRTSTHLLPDLWGHDWRRSLLYHFLVTTLNGTLSFKEVNRIPVTVGQNLKFDVMR